MLVITINGETIIDLQLRRLRIIELQLEQFGITNTIDPDMTPLHLSSMLLMKMNVYHITSGLKNEKMDVLSIEIYGDELLMDMFLGIMVINFEQTPY